MKQNETVKKNLSIQFYLFLTYNQRLLLLFFEKNIIVTIIKFKL